jgi:hypothetical protein
MQAAADARTQCACKRHPIDLHGDHVLTCKKHTGGIIAHNRIMDVVARLARNAGCSVRVNNRVTTSTATARRQGDFEFDLPLDANTRLIGDIAFCCDFHGSVVNNANLNGTAKPASHLHQRATAKIRKYRADYQNLGIGIAFVPAVVSVAGRIHGEFLRLLWILADKQARKYFALIDGDLDSDAFKWSRAGTFSYNKNALGLAIAHSSSMRAYLSVNALHHPTPAPPPPPPSRHLGTLLQAHFDSPHPSRS